VKGQEGLNMFVKSHVLNVNNFVLNDKEVQNLKDLIAFDLQISIDDVNIQSIDLVDYDYSYGYAHYYYKVVANNQTFNIHQCDDDDIGYMNIMEGLK
jgi:hypothetical protein